MSKTMTKMEKLLLVLLIINIAISAINTTYIMSISTQIAGLSAIKMPSPPVEKIKIGVLAPLTAGAIESGSQIKEGALLAAEEINAKGGVLGRQIELVFGDEEGKPEKGVAAAERLITVDGVIALTCSFHSSVVLAVGDVAHKYGVPYVIGAPGSDTITKNVKEKGWDNLFRAGFNVTRFSIGYVTFASKFLVPRGITKYCVLAEDTDWGRDFAKVVPELAKGTGLVDTGAIFVPMGAMDFYTQLTMIKERGTQIVITPITGASLTAVLRQAEELKVNCLFLVAYADYQLASVRAMVGDKAMMRVINQVPFCPGVPGPGGEKALAFAEAYKKRWGREATYFAAEAYNCIYVLCDAIERAGTLDKSKIIEALKKTDYVGVLGRVTFDPVYHNANLETFFTQWQDGKWVVLWPEKYATGELKLPW